MPEFIMTGLTFVLGGFYLFWILLIALCVGTVVAIRDRNYYWSSLCIGLVVFAVGFHFAEFGQYMISNPIVMLAYLGVYFIGGMATSICKWYYVATDAKGERNKLFKEYTDYAKTYEAEDADEPDFATFEEYVKHKMADQYHRKDHAPFRVKELNGTPTVVLNTDRHPIPEWILFWPYTILSVVFRPLWTIATNLAKRMGRLYDTISARILSA